MGISNLLPFLDKSTRQIHVSEFRGKAVAIDSYCWLHKGAISCAEQLVKGEHSPLYLNYCLKYVKMLLEYDIQPIMVFDGRHLPAKQKTEKKRREDRRLAKKQAIEFLRLGKPDEARKYFRQCIDIDPEMALALIKECRNLKVECIVAPYESDAQLAYFSINGIVDAVITEDSDLLLFGCQKVIYKMDSSGSGQLVEADKIHLSMKMKPDMYSFDKFRQMCILSGCDYLDSLPGIGLKKALKFISMTVETNPEIFLDRVPRYLNLRKIVVDSSYKENFMIADATFKHQIVFNPREKKLVYLNELEKYSTKVEHCKNAGEFFNEEEAYQLSLGNINPISMQKIDNWIPNFFMYDKLPTSHHYSIWLNFKKESTGKSKEIPTNKPFFTILTEDSANSAALEYDTQLSKELEMYKAQCPPATPSIADSHEQENEDILNLRISPTIGNFTKNPFLKSRISKFNMTKMDENVVVKSRFFSSTTISESDSHASTSSSYLSQESFQNNNFNEYAVTDSESVLDEKSDTDFELNLGGEVIDVVAEPDIDTILDEPTAESEDNDQQDFRKRKMEPSSNAFTKSKKHKVLIRDKKQPSVLDMFKRMSTL